MDVGVVLRQARARAGLNQRRLAQRAQTTQSAISAYESGRVSPTVRTLDRLLAACGLQARASLEPLLAELDARVDALLGEPVVLDGETWVRLADSFDDLPPQRGDRSFGPRCGPVTWAVDAGPALALHGLAAPGGNDLEVVVVLDDALRAWMRSTWLRGWTDDEREWSAWREATLEQMQAVLARPAWCLLGGLSLRVVEQLPPTVPLVVPWCARPVRVCTVDEVERGHPRHEEVLARWRERRAQEGAAREVAGSADVA